MCEQLTDFWGHGRGRGRSHHPEPTFLLQTLELGPWHGQQFADFGPQLHLFPQSFDPPEPSIPGYRRTGKFRLHALYPFRVRVRNQCFLWIESHLLVMHQRSGTQIREKTTGTEQSPDDIDGQIGVGSKQVAESHARMSLDMSQDPCFLLRVRGNLVGPEVL